MLEPMTFTSNLFNKTQFDLIFCRSGGSSPTVFDKRASFLQDHYLQLKTNPVNPTPNRFAEKDSLYLDLGRPEINGRVDTINSASTNSSMLLASRVTSHADTSPLSGSNFSKGLRHHGSFKGYLPGGQSTEVLKSSLYRNMQHTSESGENPDSGLLKNDRRASDFLSHSPSPFSGYQLNSPTLPYQQQQQHHHQIPQQHTQHHQIPQQHIQHHQIPQQHTHHQVPQQHTQHTGGFTEASLQSHHYPIDANEKARLSNQYKPTANFSDPSMPRLSLMGQQNQRMYDKDY